MRRSMASSTCARYRPTSPASGLVIIPRAGRGMPFAYRLVVGVEKIVVGFIEDRIVRSERFQQKCFEEPRRVCPVPLRRTRVRHRLDGLVFRA